MTNYNERLDDILQLVFNYGYNEAEAEFDPIDRGYDKFEKSTAPDIAKQAITSLIKELVAEAKPGTWVDPENTDDLEWQGYVLGVIDYEQNLLKALEENSEA